MDHKLNKYLCGMLQLLKQDISALTNMFTYMYLNLVMYMADLFCHCG